MGTQCYVSPHLGHLWIRTVCSTMGGRLQVHTQSDICVHAGRLVACDAFEWLSMQAFPLHVGRVEWGGVVVEFHHNVWNHQRVFAG